MNKKGSILLTGAGGFLGTNLVQKLKDRYKITGLEKYGWKGMVQDIKIIHDNDNELKKYFYEECPDIIIHTATCYGRNNEKASHIYEINTLMPLKLIELAIEYKTSLFVNTDTIIDKNTNPYGLSKSHFSEWLQYFNNSIPVINIKLEHFYGAKSPDHNFITWLIKKLLTNETPIKLTKGEQNRDFVHISDVLNAYDIIIQNAKMDIKNPFSEYEVTTGSSISIKELVLLLKKLTKSKSVLKFGAIPYRENEIWDVETNNSKLMKLGWQPHYKIEEGLKHVIEEIKSNIQ